MKGEKEQMNKKDLLASKDNKDKKQIRRNIGADKESIDFSELEKMLGKEVEPSDFIPPVITDSVFKFLFGTEENKEFLVELLSAILSLKKENITHLTYRNPELLGDGIQDKKSVLDIRVKLNSGEEINVEIQRFFSKDLLDRFLYYWAKMFTKQLKIGQKYKNLKKCICINLLEFKVSEYEDCHLTYHIYDDRYKSTFSDLFEIHLLELPKIEELKKLNKTLYDWLKFIQLTSRKEMEFMSKTSPMLERAIKRLESLSQDDDAYLYAVKEYFYYLDEANRLEDAKEYAIQQGLEQGKALGLEQGKALGLEQGKSLGLEQGKALGLAEGLAEGERLKALKIAKSLKENKVDISTIILSTGLTKEEVEEL